MFIVRLNEAIENRKKTNNNDGAGLELCWEELSKILSENEQETIAFLENCSEQQLYFISEVFDEVSEKLQSKGFIDCLKALDKKFPKLQLKSDIESAESYIYDLE